MLVAVLVVIKSAELLATICRIYNQGDCESLLAKEAHFLSATLEHLKVTLIKETWKQCPLHKQALVWLIKHLKVSTKQLRGGLTEDEY